MRLSRPCPRLGGERVPVRLTEPRIAFWPARDINRIGRIGGEPVTTDLAQRMRSLRDEQLFEIVYARPEDGIVPEAVDAARSELAARNLGEEQDRELREQTLEVRQYDANRATRHLPGGFVALFMIIGLTLVGTLGIAGLFATGRRQMAIDAIYATLVGVCLSALLALGFVFLLG